MLGVLEALSEQSLVVSTAGAVGGSRQRMLEPVAQYARDRLTEAGEWQSAAAAHAEHFRTVAETLAPRYRDSGQVDALARVDVEHANLTAAIERSLAAGDATTAARLTWALWMYWWLRGHLALGRRLAESVLDQELPAGVLPRAELAAATMAFALDDVTAALGWWSSALAHAEDDPVTMANAVAGEGLAALAGGDLATAAERFELARPIAERGGADGEWTRALSLIWLGTVRLLEGDADGAVAHIEQGLDSARARGDRLTSYVALYNLSQVEMGRGDHARAREHLEEGLRLSRQTGDLANLAYLLDATAVLEATLGSMRGCLSCWVRRRRSARRSVPGGTATTGPTRQRPRAPLRRLSSISERTGTTTPWTSGAAYHPTKPRTWPWRASCPRLNRTPHTAQGRRGDRLARAGPHRARPHLAGRDSSAAHWLTAARDGWRACLAPSASDCFARNAAAVHHSYTSRTPCSVRGARWFGRRGFGYGATASSASTTRESA